MLSAKEEVGEPAGFPWRKVWENRGVSQMPKCTEIAKTGARLRFCAIFALRLESKARAGAPRERGDAGEGREKFRLVGVEICSWQIPESTK